MHPHVAGAVAGMQKIRTFYDCLHAAHRKTRLGSMPFHQIVGELDRVDDRGNKLQPNIPDIWRTTAVRGEYPDCMASVAQVFRSMCGPLTISGTREDRAVVICRDESAFTRGDKIMGVPWPAYRRPTAREVKEKAERGERTQRTDSAPPWGSVPVEPGDGAPSGGDVDMPEPREEPAAAEAKKAGDAATKKEGRPYAGPYTGSRYTYCARSPSRLTGQFTEEERAMLPTTIAQFEAERALAELRTVNQVVSDPRDSEEYANWETSAHDTLSYASIQERPSGEIRLADLRSDPSKPARETGQTGACCSSL